VREFRPEQLVDARPRPQPGGTDMPRGGRAATDKRQGVDRPTTSQEALARQVDLPRTDERSRVDFRGHAYHLRASEVQVLATVGAFRVVDTRDLPGEPQRWHGDLQELRRQGLVDIRAQHGDRTALATLTTAGRELLDGHQRTEPGEARQSYYAGIVKPRELAHDAQLYRTYAQAADRLEGTGARVTRVVLDFELKRDYQRFLQEGNRGDRHASGRPTRSRAEVEEWADAHGLRMVEGHVQFPDVRIEYEQPDGRTGREDVELATEHYSSRQMAAKRAAGFNVQGGGSRRGGAPFDPHAAEEVLR
jgi:hypothetical protein